MRRSRRDGISRRSRRCAALRSVLRGSDGGRILMRTVAVVAGGRAHPTQLESLAVVRVKEGRRVAAVTAFATRRHLLAESAGRHVDDGMRIVAIATGRHLAELARLQHKSAVERAAVHRALLSVTVAARGERGLFEPSAGLLGSVLSRLEAHMTARAVEQRVQRMIPSARVEGDALRSRRSRRLDLSRQAHDTRDSGHCHGWPARRRSWAGLRLRARP